MPARNSTIQNLMTAACDLIESQESRQRLSELVVLMTERKEAACSICDALVLNLSKMLHQGYRPESAKEMMPRYWIGEVASKDDFGFVIDGIMYDARTENGTWATMSQQSWQNFGCGTLGTGFGQKYVKTSSGRWLKVEG